MVDGEVFSGVGSDWSASSENGAGSPSEIMDLYSSAGPTALSQLNAAAGITIWDASAETLLLFRDRGGAVPIFYLEGDGAVVWASDIQTLLRTVVAPKLNFPALDFFIAAGFVPGPWTFVEQIRKIPAAAFN